MVPSSFHFFVYADTSLGIEWVDSDKRLTGFAGSLDSSYVPYADSARPPFGLKRVSCHEGLSFNLGFSATEQFGKCMGF